MRLTKRHTIFLALSALCLVFGLMTYLFFSPGIFALDLFNIHPVRLYFIQNVLLRHIVTGYVSDILWVIALCLVTVVFTELKHLSLPERILILCLPVMTEFAQYFKFIRGTFDLADIAVYIIVIITFIFLFPGLLKIKT